MKTKLYILRVAIVLVPLLLSACASSASPAAPAQAVDAAGAKVQAVRVAYTGVVESMEGSQWVVNSQSITVDPSVVQGGPFKVGDTITLEGHVQADGSILITRIEMPSADDLAVSSSVPPAPSTGLSTELIFDDDGNEAWGTVEAISAESITVSGQTFPFASGAEIKALVVVGAFVKVEFLVNADGTLSVREVKLADPSDVGEGDDDNGNENDNDGNENDDNGNENDNDDNGNENDDNGNENENEGNENENEGNENENEGNENDDNGNENDDNGNENDDDGNTNDDNSNDDDNEDSNDDNGDDSNDDNGDDNGDDNESNDNDD